MDIANKTLQLKQDFDDVYDKGYADMDLEWCKKITNNGTREVYSNAFAYCNFSGYTFPITVRPINTAGANKMFYSYRGEYLPSGVDLSQLDVSNGAVNYGVHLTFAWASYNGLVKVPDYGLQAPADYHTTYAYSRKLHTIEIIRTKKSTKYTSTFTECFALANVTFEGEIGQNLSVSACGKLTHDSLMSIIGCLYDYASEGSTTTHTLTLGSTNLAKLTEEEQAIATNKGWNLQ